MPICKDEDMTFPHGHGKKYKTAFNTDVLVRREKVIGDHYYTDLFSFECMHTGYTIARYINGKKYKSRYEMLNHAVMEYWLYRENGDGFGMQRNAFLLQIRLTTFSVYVAQAGQTVLNGVGQT